MDKEILTMGIFAHANAGKTTITEQLLYHTGVKKEIGRVDYGNTSSDSLSVEKQRGISVKSSIVTIPIKNRLIQLIDTPGHVDFSAEIERAISVLDGAILVVSGVEGIEPQTQIIWRELQKRKVPTIIFINKMDRKGSDYNRIISEMSIKLDSNLFKVLSIEKDQNDSLIYYEPKLEEMIINLAEIDNEILEKYYNNEELSKNWFEDRVSSLAQTACIYPVLGGSALHNFGIDRLIDSIDKYLPSFEKKVDEKFSGYVYMIKRDKKIREIYLKILKGILTNREDIMVHDDIHQKIKTMSKVNGLARVKADQLVAGEIGIVTGLSSVMGDIIGDKNINFIGASFVKPLFTTEVTVKDKANLSNLVNALSILQDEDPSINLMYKPEIGRISLDLMGDLQAEIISNILKERFEIDAIFEKSTIIHKETPAKTAYGEASYNRFSVVGLEIKPLSRNSGLVFKSNVSKDFLFAKYQNQIERLVKKYSEQGLFGWQVTDFEVTLVSGSSDSICSESFDFNIATPIALMRALKAANTKLLEPIMNFDILVPEENSNKILQFLLSNGIIYENITTINQYVKTSGKAPLDMIITISKIITQITSGKGSIIMEPFNYELKQNDEIVVREYMNFDPRNEELFIMNMNGSKENLDRNSKRK